jgi:hypothetical protein
VTARQNSRDAAEHGLDGGMLKQDLVYSVRNQGKSFGKSHVVGVTAAAQKALYHVSVGADHGKFGLCAAAVDAEEKAVAGGAEQIVGQNPEKGGDADKVLKIGRRDAALPVGDRLKADQEPFGKLTLREPTLSPQLADALADQFYVYHFDLPEVYIPILTIYN